MAITPEENIQAWLDKMAPMRADIAAHLPSWVQVSTAVDNISNLAEAKAFLKKLSRIVYWLAKNSEE